MTRPEGSGLRVYTPKKTPRRRDDVCEMIRALMDGPKTRLELLDFVEFHSNAVGDWIRSFRNAGLVRISERRPNKEHVYSLQAKPFALPDAPLSYNRKAKSARERYAGVAA